MDTRELKPCPFCGGPAKHNGSTIWCYNLKCWGPFVESCTDLDDAIAAWNTRTSDAALSSQAAEIERLREALKPFAVAGSTLPDYVPDHRYTEVSASHLRRAHIVYAALPPKPNKEGE